MLFDTARADLKPGADKTIDHIAEFLVKNDQRSIVINGHTDSRGSDEYNERLSESRAGSVREALIRRGVAADRVTARGLGEAFPVATNDTAAGRQQNRRVEIVISDS